MTVSSTPLTITGRVLQPPQLAFKVTVRDFVLLCMNGYEHRRYLVVGKSSAWEMELCGKTIRQVGDPHEVGCGRLRPRRPGEAELCLSIIILFYSSWSVYFSLFFS